MNTKKLFVLFALILTLVLTACGTKEVIKESDVKSTPSMAAAPATSAQPKAQDQTIKAFGQAATWDDGISISVSKPAVYVPNPEAAGVIPGNKSIVIKLVLTNNTDKVFKPYVDAQMTSGGSEAHHISDLGNPLKSGFAPTTAVLPGKTIQWYEAYSVADPKDLTLEVAPGFSVTYKSAIFTNSK